MEELKMFCRIIADLNRKFIQKQENPPDFRLKIARTDIFLSKSSLNIGCFLLNNHQIKFLTICHTYQH